MLGIAVLGISVFMLGSPVLGISVFMLGIFSVFLLGSPVLGISVFMLGIFAVSMLGIYDLLGVLAGYSRNFCVYALLSSLMQVFNNILSVRL
jgi:hypothetical protein